ncbi:MAG: cyclase family protein [Eubacterium sp.]|nr:cyclase family protein [Eubacterium sp.]
MKKRISYDLRACDPGWPGNPKVEVSPFTQIEKGDSCNQYVMTLFNHFGSHMDGARHFNNQGRRLCEEPFDRFFYDRPLLIDVPKQAGEAITQEDLVPWHERIAGADLLMLRTGFAEVRTNDPRCYAENGPYVTPSAAQYLMEHFGSQLKAIALDTISLGSPAATEDGGVTHEIMLGCHRDSEAICIIEDVSFAGLEPDSIISAVAMPLFVEKIDSAPVTMWVEIDDACK